WSCGTLFKTSWRQGFAIDSPRLAERGVRKRRARSPIPVASDEADGASSGGRSYLPDRFSILAQVSRSVTVRLNTGRSGVESLSTQKYPNRSNWYRDPKAT